MPTYAQQTNVTVNRSVAEIERALTRWGAEQFAYGWNGDRGVIGFVVRQRQVRLTVPLPDRQDKSFTHTPTGRPRSASQAKAAYDQAVRQRWRALTLIVKAKLEAVEAGIVEFEDEFAMDIVLPNGQVVAEWVRPQLDRVYETNEMPALLPGSGQ